jgi:hypothetical protein
MLFNANGDTIDDSRHIFFFPFPISRFDSFGALLFCRRVYKIKEYLPTLTDVYISATCWPRGSGRSIYVPFVNVAHHAADCKGVTRIACCQSVRSYSPAPMCANPRKVRISFLTVGWGSLLDSFQTPWVGLPYGSRGCFLGVST